MVWIDAQLPPQLAPWLSNSFGVSAQAIRDLGLRNAEDQEIFQAARQTGTVIISKDSDFVELVLHHGPPPQVIWVTCGNVSNLHLQTVFEKTFREAVDLLKVGEPIVEIGDPGHT